MIRHEMHAEHDHARDPEKQDLVRRNEQRRGIENFLVARLFRPTKRSERQQSGRKPGIEHVRILLELRSRTFRAHGWRFPGDDDLPAIAAMPRRNAMSPPELA